MILFGRPAGDGNNSKERGRNPIVEEEVDKMDKEPYGKNIQKQDKRQGPLGRILKGSR